MNEYRKICLAGQDENPDSTEKSTFRKLMQVSCSTVFERGECRTGDLGGKAGTTEYTDAICAEFKTLGV